MPSRISKLTPYTCPTDSITHALLRVATQLKMFWLQEWALGRGGGQTYGQAEAGTEIFSKFCTKVKIAQKMF